MTATTEPTVQPFGNAAAIPDLLKSQKRWTPWRAVWNAKRHKHDKLPKDANNVGRNISTASPDKWFTFADAHNAHLDSKGATNGVGYVMTRAHGVVGVDLDGAIDPATKVVAPWALEVLRQLDSYTEVSPSGEGLRVFVQGELPDGDWVNHDVGIEVYAGHAPRFLTVTGRSLAGYVDADGVVLGDFPPEVKPAPPGALAGLERSHRKSVAQQVADGDTPVMPVLPDVEDLPSLASLNLPASALAFLEHGECDGDRSRRLWSTSIALFGAGLTLPEVQALLMANPHAFEVALDHRGQDADKAALYLWKHMSCKAQRLGVKRALTDEDFETFEEATIPAAAALAKHRKRAYTAASEVARRPPRRELIHGVLPAFEAACIFGPSGSGKSFMVFSLIHSLVTGDPWNGHRVLQPGRALYVCLEGAGGLGSRVKAHEKHFGVAYGDRLVVVEGSLNMTDKADVKDFILEVQALGKFAVIVIDTTSQASPGSDENSSEDMGLLLANCKTVASQTAAGVLLVSHTGKDATRGVRGWSGQRAAMDVQLEVTCDTKTKARALKVDKAKDGRDDGAWPFTLLVVDLGTDSDGNAISSCVAVPAAAAGVAPTTNDRAKAWARGANQLAVEAALREIWQFNRAPIARQALSRAAVTHRTRLAREAGEDCDLKKTKDGVRDAIKNLITDGRLVLENEHLTAPGLHIEPPPDLFCKEAKT